MRRFAPLILLLCLPAHGTGIRTSIGESIRATGDELLQFAPPDGTGLPVIADLCDTYSAEMTGNYFCLRGDGTFLGGGQTMTAQGAPSTGTQRTCPNGPNCTSTNGIRTNGTTQYWKGANMASPTGDFTMCWLGYLDSTPNISFMGKADTGANLLSIRMETAANGTVNGFVYKNDASPTSTLSAPLVQGAEHFICTSYDFITDGTSLLTTYIDGSTSGITNSTTAVGPAQPSVTSAWQIGARFNTPSFFIQGRVRNAFMTEKAVSAATIAAMAHTALADVPTGTHAETITFTRNSAKFCSLVDNSAGTWIPANRPCVMGGGLNVEGTSSATNLVIRSQAFDNAAWTKSNVTAPTADTDIAPDGTKTAEVLTNSGAGGFVESTGFVITGTDCSASVFVKTAVSTQSMSIACRDTTAGADRCTATLTATTTWQRVYCTNNSVVTGNTHTLRIFPGGTGGIAGNSVIAWGGQQQALFGGPTTYIATAGTSATRVAEAATILLPFKPSGDISVSFDLTQTVFAAHSPLAISLATDDRLVPLYNRSPGVTVFQFYGREPVTGYVFPATNLVATPADGSTTHISFVYQNGSRASSASFYSAGALIGTSTGGSRTVDVTDADRLVFASSFSTGWGNVTSNVCISRTVTGCQ